MCCLWQALDTFQSHCNLGQYSDVLCVHSGVEHDSKRRQLRVHCLYVCDLTVVSASQSSYGVYLICAVNVLSTPVFYISLVLCVVLCFIPDFSIKLYVVG